MKSKIIFVDIRRQISIAKIKLEIIMKKMRILPIELTNLLKFYEILYKKPTTNADAKRTKGSE